MDLPENLPGRWPKTITAGPDVEIFSKIFEVDIPADNDPVFAALARALVDDDEVANDLIDWMGADKSNAGIFKQASDDGLDSISAPAAELERFFDRFESRPVWADPEIMMIGANAHFRLGPIGRLPMATLGLLSGYRNSAVAKTLVATGSLTDATARRMKETSKYVFDVCNSNGMGRFSNGVKSSIQVRRVHAFVRRSISAMPTWQHDSWGHPVAVMDSLVTSLNFWIPLILAEKDLGYSLSSDEKRGLMTLWNYAGYLQGIPEELLPDSLEQSYKIYLGAKMVTPVADKDSLLLANSLMAVIGELSNNRRWLRRAMFHGAAVRLLPACYLNDLQISNTVFEHWLSAIRPIVKRKEKRAMADPLYLQRRIEEGKISMARSAGTTATFEPETVIHNFQNMPG